MSSSVTVDSDIGLLSTRQNDGNGDHRELTMEEVKKAVKRLKNGKEGGDDGIVVESISLSNHWWYQSFMVWGPGQ